VSRASYIIDALSPLVEKAPISAKSILAFSGSKKDFGILKTWLGTLKISAGRAPAGGKKHAEKLRWMLQWVDSSNTELVVQNMKNSLSWWTEDDIAFINKKFRKKKGESDTLVLKNATYINKSIMAYKVFKGKAEFIDKFLSTLKGYHKKALGDNLTIWFVKKDLSKATAKYVGEKDLLYIRPDRIGNTTDGYGSAVYVTAHELGHRYERRFRQRTDFDMQMWWTTKYSRKDTMSGGEQFAELFALSHWSDKYPEYTDTIKRFQQEIV